MGHLSANYEQAASHLAAASHNDKIDVPVLPETAHKVMVLTQDPDSDAAKLAAIIQSDPTMGGHVMRIANSAAFTPNSNLVSIQQAVARLGMMEISNIALSTSLNSKMFHAPGYEKFIGIIWQHALASALWAKEVARTMRSNVEAAFLCGLLHSIGKPVILQTLADAKPSLPQLTQAELEQIYNEFEASYCQNVASKWGLPEIVAEAIGYYKDFTKAPRDNELAATIAFSAQLADLMLFPETIEKDNVLNSSALDVINLYPDQVLTLLTKEPAIQTSMDILSL
jgi:HD-like signal output (HDOD) protein